MINGGTYFFHINARALVSPAERERVLLALPDPDGVGLVEQLLLLVLRHLQRLDPPQRVAVPARAALLLERSRVGAEVGLLLLQPVDGVEPLMKTDKIALYWRKGGSKVA